MSILKTTIYVLACVGLMFFVLASAEDLAHAASDSEILAQLMANMDDPEMLSNPAFQSQIKKMQNVKSFKEALQKTKELLNDPSTTAKMRAQMEHVVKLSQNHLPNGGEGGIGAPGDAVKEAMNMINDPEVFGEAMKLMQDPEFVERLAAFTKDPAFSGYREAMANMMKDPDQKAKFEAMASAMGGSMREQL
jgi:mannitol/fructose-specific phosphotransferase system IIA component (Ntr-type)